MKYYRPLADMKWVQHGDNILVLGEEGYSQKLTGTEAALWRWVNQSLNWHDLLDLYSALLNVPVADGEISLLETLHHWSTIGLLEVSDG